MQYHYKIVDSITKEVIKDTKKDVPDYITEESFTGYHGLKDADENGRQYVLAEKIDPFKFSIQSYILQESSDINKPYFDEDYDLAVDAENDIFGHNISGDIDSPENIKAEDEWMNEEQHQILDDFDNND